MRFVLGSVVRCGQSEHKGAGTRWGETGTGEWPRVRDPGVQRPGGHRRNLV